MVEECIAKIAKLNIFLKNGSFFFIKELYLKGILVLKNLNKKISKKVDSMTMQAPIFFTSVLFLFHTLYVLIWHIYVKTDVKTATLNG